MTTYTLGRKVNHDPRSKEYPAFRATHHRPILHRTMGPVLDQGDLGSCVGNAAAHALNTVGSHRTPSKICDESFAVEIYSGATKLDPWDGAYPPDDTGTDGNSAAKFLRNVGRITGWSHAFGLDHLLLAHQVRPVMIGIPWHKSMFTPDADGFVHPDGNEVGGHETLVRGDYPDEQYVLVRNSWGPNWGIRGHYKIKYDDLAALLENHGDATILVP